MTAIRTRLLAAALVTGFAALFVGAGVALSTADDPKAPDLSDLRDAVKAAAKRGENVGDIQKALDALDKSLAAGWAPPKQGRAEPPAELTALRGAVEAAARKGENVEEIRKQLDAVEMKMIGRLLVTPKPVPPAEPPKPNPGRNDFQPPIRPFPQIQPAFPGGDFPLPGGAGIDPAGLQKMQEQLRKAMEGLQKNPNDPESQKLLEEVMKGAFGGPGGFNPGLVMPDMERIPDFGGGRVGEKFRLGVRMERVGSLTADQLGIDAGRGVAITEVIPGTAAEKSGFKVHDIVLEFAGKPVSNNPDDFARIVQEVKGGEKVDAVVLRKGKKTELKGIDLPAQPVPARPAVRPPVGLGLPNALPNIDALPNPGGLQLLPLPGPPVAGPVEGNAVNSTSVSVTDGKFTVRSVQDDVNYTITGKMGANGPELATVSIADGAKVIEATELPKVPEQYRATVEKLLKTVGTKR